MNLSYTLRCVAPSFAPLLAPAPYYEFIIYAAVRCERTLLWIYHIRCGALRPASRRS